MRVRATRVNAALAGTSGAARMVDQMHWGRAGRTDGTRTHLSACVAPMVSNRVSRPSMPDVVTMGAKSVGSAVHCQSGLTE